MHFSAWVIWYMSLVGIGIILVKEFGTRTNLNNKKWFFGAICIVVVSIMIVANHFLADTAETMSDSVEMPWKMTIAMFVTMLFGMVAQHFYFLSPRMRFRWWQFIKPFFASPIVLMPLLASHQSSLIQTTTFGFSELMVLLVAFQNGFFWKVVFESASKDNVKSS